ncbi:glutathione S-transferase family protein [Paracoccus pacificus]|uniref:Glutathione S-transferase family protein n=1 Tax=Paracoccus pacificus TaxID=1463598 RepID=A0ABW4RBT6_9RHOB
MTLTLYYHPLASACWKVLVALYANGTAFTPRLIDLSQQSDRDLMAGLTPLGKMPALRDDASGATIAETSVIIEWLDQNRPGPAPLIPKENALDVRTWDRVFDFYVHDPMQRIVSARLFLSESAAAEIAAEARKQLDQAYRVLDRHLIGKDWATGPAFTLADCAAAPALFYAGILQPFDGHAQLTGYFERLLALPAFARVLDEARPYFDMFPFQDQMPARFR